MGDDEDVLAGGRLAVPAVGQVEQPPSDDHHRRVAVVALHEVGRSLSGPALVVGALEGPGDVTVAVPVEQRPDVVVVVGDEPVQGDHRMTVLPMISPFRLRSSITIDSTAEPTPAGAGAEVDRRGAGGCHSLVRHDRLVVYRSPV
jgi:hypothetical protein